MAAALLLVRFADEWTTFLPAGALEPIRADLRASYAEASAILVALPAGGLLGEFFVVATDYVSRRWIATLGAIGYGAALLAFGASHSLPVMIGAAFVWGASSDAFVHGCEVSLTDLAGEDLPRALSRINAWAAVGDFLGPVTLGVAAAVGLGWRGAFIGCGVAMLAYAAWLASQRFPPPRGRAELPNPFAGVLAIALDRRVLLLAAVMGLFSLLDEPLAAFLIAFLEHDHRRTAAAANGVVLAWVLGQFGGFSLYGRLVGGRAATRTLIAAAVVMALSLPTTIFLPILAAQGLAALVFGVASAAFYSTLQAEILASRPGQAGSVSAVVSLVGMLGMGFPLAAGALSDGFGPAAGVALYAAVPAVVLALVLLDAARRVRSAGR
ncbi:MAG TPA: MFS transporter [Caulobacteraceae bacterium]|nr:MFS transporter [Caulobacteraceae bacterium]